MIGLFFSRLKIFPHWLFLTLKDLVLWLFHRGWKIFEGWGIHLYVADFGAGKTCSMVRDAFLICSKYPQVTLLTNVTVKNFPEHTKVVPLKCFEDILNAPANTLVLIDEIGTIFNSRDWSSKKGGGVPKDLFQRLVQIRKRHIMVLATTQHYRYMDVQLRRICDDVTVCSAFLNHPFTRMITNRIYRGVDYELFCDNPMFLLTCKSAYSYVQTDKLRALYDTDELIESMLGMEYLSDSEILAKQSGAPPVSVPLVPTDKKQQRELLNKIRKGGI